MNCFLFLSLHIFYILSVNTAVVFFSTASGSLHCYWCEAGLWTRCTRSGETCCCLQTAELTRCQWETSPEAAPYCVCVCGLQFPGWHLRCDWGEILCWNKIKSAFICGGGVLNFPFVLMSQWMQTVNECILVKGQVQHKDLNIMNINKTITLL